MFILTTKHLFSWPATAYTPDPEKAGVFLKQEFTLKFEALPLDQVQEIEQASIGPFAIVDQATMQKNLLQAVVKGWGEDVVDEGSQPVPFTDEALHQAMQHSWFRIAAFNSYREALQGDQARLGN